MNQPIIGIAANTHYQKNQEFFDQRFTYTPQGFINGVHAAGGVPLLFPIGDPALAKSYIASVDKLLLTGGQDVTPVLYGEEPHIKLGATSRERDDFELALIKEAIAQKKPIFTVCRGTQLLNVALGGTLYQDLAEYSGWEVKHDMFPTLPDFALHSVTIEKESLLFPLLGENKQVNSYHHQALKEVAKELTVTARSFDGVVEAVEGRNGLKVFGVQWHPELTHAQDALEQKLFDFFVQEF